MFLYFIPGRPTGPQVPQSLFDCQFDGRDPTQRPVTGRGPDGGSGCILCDQSVADIAGYYPERQEWQQINDQLWMGWERDRKPNPEGLRRAKQIRGEVINISGQDWVVPVARRFTFETGVPTWVDQLPKKMVYQGGAWQFAQTSEKYQRLWEIGAKYWDQITQIVEGGEAKPLTIIEAAEMASEVLSFNYRVWHHEISAMAVLDGDTIRAILDTVVDKRTWDAWVEKKSQELSAEPDGSSSPAGATDY